MLGKECLDYCCPLIMFIYTFCFILNMQMHRLLFIVAISDIGGREFKIWMIPDGLLGSHLNEFI